MQAPFAFDSDGNLVISAKMVEALGLAKDQSTKQWGLFVKDGRVRADLLSVESLTFGKLRESRDMVQTDPSEVIRAISGEIKRDDLHSDLNVAIDAITGEQQARADGDSALAEEIGRLWEKLGEKTPAEASSMKASKYHPEKIEITVGGDGMSATGEIHLSGSCSVDGCPIQVTDDTTVGEIRAGIAEKCYRLLKTLPAK